MQKNLSRKRRGVDLSRESEDWIMAIRCEFGVNEDGFIKGTEFIVTNVEQNLNNRHALGQKPYLIYVNKNGFAFKGRFCVIVFTTDYIGACL